MKMIGVVLLWLLMTMSKANAQDVDRFHHCSKQKISAYRHSAKTTVASPEEEKYDVKHVHLDLAMDNISVKLSGNAITTAMVLEPNFSLYVCELNPLLIIDSVFINNTKATFSRTGNIVNVFCPAVLQTGAVFTAQIYYGGTPEAGTVFALQNGMNNAIAEPWGNNVTYTLSQPYNAKDWWPCKQSLQDKVDSADIWITVPDSLMAGSNGLLKQVTPMPGNKKRFEWKTNYPTSYYLFSVAVAAYSDYSFTTTLPDGTKLPVQNFIYNKPGVLDEHKKGIDSTADMLYYYSELFGTYPFYKEKYGHCMAPLFGGMEHQTMTTLLHFRSPLVAHELAHQWFGDYVTCATWQDIWINEGFASYAEYLHAEKFWSAANAYNYMQQVHSKILRDTNMRGSVYVPATDTTNIYRVFDSRLSYQKGSAVLHSLRYYINKDEVFFNILRTFLQAHAFANANTEDFKKIAEQVSGMDLDVFFAEWMYGEGYPEYQVTWNQTNNTLFLQLEQQTTVPSSVPFYHMPVEVLITFTDGDTLLRMDNDSSKQLYTFKAERKIINIEFDPRNGILNEETVTRDLKLGLEANFGTNVGVFPNPTTDEWKIVNLDPEADMILTDMSGKVLWSGRANNIGMAISASSYARGMYLLHITGAGKKITKRLAKL